MIFSYAGYFIIGGLLNSSHGDHGGLFKWVMIYLVGVFATFLITWMRTANIGMPDELAYSYFSPNVLLASIGAFMLARKIPTAKHWGARIIIWVSDASFFIYFVHIIVLEFLRYGTFGIKVSTIDTHPALSIPKLAFLVFVFSVAIAWLVRWIPGSRRILG